MTDAELVASLKKLAARLRQEAAGDPMWLARAEICERAAERLEEK